MFKKCVFFCSVPLSKQKNNKDFKYIFMQSACNMVLGGGGKMGFKLNFYIQVVYFKRTEDCRGCASLKIIYYILHRVFVFICTHFSLKRGVTINCVH